MKNISRHLKLLPKIFRLYRNPFLYYGDKLGLFKRGELLGVNLRNGLEFKVHAGNSDVNGITEIFFSEGYRAFPGIIRNGQVLVDIGANIGIFSVRAAAHLPTGKVFAFEPNPRVFSLLNENIAINRMREKVRILPFAVAGSSGERALYFEEGNWGGASFLKQNERNTHEFRVRSIGINEIFGTIGEDHIDYLKIDVEGGEGEIVGAMERATAERIGCLFVEYHMPRVSPADLKAKLTGLGFELVGEFKVPPSLLFVRK